MDAPTNPDKHPAVALHLATLTACVESGDQGPTKLILTDRAGGRVELVGGESYTQDLDGLRELVGHTRDYQQALVQRHLEDQPAIEPRFSNSGAY